MPPFAGNEFGGMRLPSGQHTVSEGTVLPKFIGAVANLATPTLLLRPSSDYKWLYVNCENRDNAAISAVWAFRNGDYVPRTAAAATNVDITDDEFDITAHGYETGDGPYKMTTTTTLPEPFATSPQTIFWVRRVTANAISFHPTYVDAINGTNKINLTTVGVGTHTVGGMTAPLGTGSVQATITDGYGQFEVHLHAANLVTQPFFGDASKLLKFLAPEKMTVVMGLADVQIGFTYWWTK